MPNYIYICRDCEHTTEINCKYVDRTDTTECSVCRGTAEYSLQAPGIMTHSYRDGANRKGWKDLKEASKLNVAAAQADTQEEKAAIKKEMRKTGYTFTK